MPMWGRLASNFLQRRAIGSGRLLETRRAPFARVELLEHIAELREHIAENVLCLRPFVRDALAGQFLQRCAIGSDRLLKTRRAALAFSELPKRTAQIDLCTSPF